MAKKQTRRSISVSRGTYERLKAYCETNQISMSQFVERRVGDFLGRSGATAPAPQSAAQVPSAPERQPAPLRHSGASSSGVSSATMSGGVSGARMPTQNNIPNDAFQVKPAAQAAPITTPAPSRMSSINQPISQPVAAPRPASKPKSDEPLLKDPDAKLTADQIFTF